MENGAYLNRITRTDIMAGLFLKLQDRFRYDYMIGSDLEIYDVLAEIANNYPLLKRCKFDFGVDVSQKRHSEKLKRTLNDLVKKGYISVKPIYYGNTTKSFQRGAVVNEYEMSPQLKIKASEILKPFNEDQLNELERMSQEFYALLMSEEQ